VDTHVYRVARRLCLAKRKRHGIEKELMQVIPRDTGSPSPTSSFIMAQVCEARKPSATAVTGAALHIEG